MTYNKGSLKLSKIISLVAEPVRAKNITIKHLFCLNSPERFPNRNALILHYANEEGVLRFYTGHCSYNDFD